MAVSYNLLGETLNSSICNKITNQTTKDSCNIFVDVNKGLVKDMKMCDNVIDSENKDDCYDIFGIRDHQACKEIYSQYKKDSCYWHSATFQLNPDLCNEIFSIEARDGCYRETALGLRNVTLCDKVSNENNRNFCYKDIENS